MARTHGRVDLALFRAGVPATAYAVFIARKQWQQVAGVLDDPSEMLIVEGYPTVDPRFPGITVLATAATTKGL